MCSAKRAFAIRASTEFGHGIWLLSVGRSVTIANVHLKTAMFIERRDSYSPSVIGGMTFFHGHKNSAASGADFSTCRQRSFNGRAIVGKIDNLRGEMHRSNRRRRPEKLDRVFRRDCAGRVGRASAVHQMIGSRPVTMAIEQRPNDAAVENSGKRLVFWFRLPVGYDFAILGKTADPQSFRVGRAATPARVVRRVRFL